MTKNNNQAGNNANKESTNNGGINSGASKYSTATIKKLPNAAIEITGTIEYPILDTYRAKALQSINESITIDGFRKGKIPESVLIQKAGPMAILEEMAEIALSHAYPAIVINEKLDPIGRPEVRITKLAENNPLEFSITTAISPTVSIADYKKIAKEVNASATKEAPIEVTEEDINKVIDELRASQVDHSGHSHDHDKMTKEEHDEFVKKSLPELNDDFAKSIGKFADVAELKSKVKENIATDKKIRAKDKRRAAIINAIIKDSTMELPNILIDSEVQRIENQFSADVERMGVKLADYLTHSKKTIEDLRKDWRPEADQKARTQLILNEIALKESIKPDQKQIDEEVAVLQSRYKDADKERIQIFIETVLTNEKVLEFLEGIK